MTATNDNDDLAFTDTMDPYQDLHARREALQIALALEVKKIEPSTIGLIQAADEIQAWLHDGTVPYNYFD